MSEVYVIESLRTPLGSFGGTLADVEAPRLAATVMAALLQKSGLPAETVDEVIIGQVLAGGTGQAARSATGSQRSASAAAKRWRRYSSGFSTANPPQSPLPCGGEASKASRG